jgi:hypothetical protein
MIHRKRWCSSKKRATPHVTGKALHTRHDGATRGPFGGAWEKSLRRPEGAVGLRNRVQNATLSVFICCSATTRHSGQQQQGREFDMVNMERYADYVGRVGSREKLYAAVPNARHRGPSCSAIGSARNSSASIPATHSQSSRLPPRFLLHARPQTADRQLHPVQIRPKSYEIVPNYTKSPQHVRSSCI